MGVLRGSHTDKTYSHQRVHIQKKVVEQDQQQSKNCQNDHKKIKIIENHPDTHFSAVNCFEMRVWVIFYHFIFLYGHFKEWQMVRCWIIVLHEFKNSNVWHSKNCQTTIKK